MKYTNHAFIVTEDNKLFGTVDTSRWDALRWYQKLYGFFNRRYKLRFISIRPLTLK